MESNNKQTLAEFYKLTSGKPSSKLMVKALLFIKNKNKALNIGGGALRDGTLANRTPRHWHVFNIIAIKI